MNVKQMIKHLQTLDDLGHGELPVCVSARSEVTCEEALEPRIADVTYRMYRTDGLMSHGFTRHAGPCVWIE